MATVHFWLRHEIKPFEQRTPLLPENAKVLLDAGHKVTVEKSTTRCRTDAEYATVGCTMVEAETWPQAPQDAVILGLKELPENDQPLKHNHVFFAHCYKGQAGSADLLKRFKNGNGHIWDIEFMNNEQGRRIAAFGRAAGIVGMAVGLIAWANRQLQPNQLCAALDTAPSYKELVKRVTDLLHQAKEKCGHFPSIIVVGALGRCGGGACWFAEQCGLSVTKWDLEETKAGGPFAEVIQHDIFLNTIYLTSKIPPFITNELISQEKRKLSIVVDVSCDATNPNNPVPIYNSCTNFASPCLRVLSHVTNPVDVIAIDHLPSLVPAESSKEFADDLLPHLLQFPSSYPWKCTAKWFHEKVAII